MKFVTYVLRNARRSPVRSLLAIGSTTMCLFLMMILFSYLSVSGAVGAQLKTSRRLVTMSSQGFAQPVPVARLNEIAAMDGVEATTTFSWFGGKYKSEIMPFAQFGVTPETMFAIYDEIAPPSDQIAAFKADKKGCVIGRKLAEERNIKIGEPLPLEGNGYPFNLDLVVRGIFDGPSNRDLRTCYFHWDYMNEEFKKVAGTSKMIDNAGVIMVKCKPGASIVGIKEKIDSSYTNSDTPTRTQTEEAFAAMFAEMAGDLRGMILWIGVAVLFSLIFVAANAMAMALRERTTEVAVLKAIGFDRSLVINLILAESILVTAIGGVLGAFGAKLLFDTIDLSRYSVGALPFFYVPWSLAFMGIGVSILIGFVSGVFPAIGAARISVINGLRKVV